MLKVTIGISFYKDCDTLQYAINSVLGQTYQNWELLLLDDGSSDGSLEIAKSFLGDPRVRLLSDGENKGLATRLNELIEQAGGKYFARMDADDIMHPHRIEEQVRYLEMHPDVDVVGTGAYSISNDGKILGIRRLGGIPQDIEDVFRGSIFIHPSVMGKTLWFQENRYETAAWAHRAEDYELWCRTFSYSKFALLSEPLMFYREDSSLSKGIEGYMSTFDSMSNILCREGKPFLKKANLHHLLCENKLKKWIYWLAWKCNKLDFLLRHRYVGLTGEEYKKAVNLVKIYKN